MQESVAVGATATALCLLVVLPFLVTGWFALTDFSFSLPNHDGSFVGGENFRRALADDRFVQALGLTLTFAFVAVTIELLLGLLLAVTFPLETTASRWLIPAISAPVLLSGVVVGLAWRMILQGDYGILPFILRRCGWTSLGSILGDPSLALAAIVAVDIWQWTPFCFLVLLACRASLPQAPYLAARLDGASRFQTFRDITLPGLRAGILVCVLFRMMDAIREFDKVAVLTNGGPGSHTELLSLYLWNVAVTHGELGYASALTAILYVVVLLGTNLFLTLARRGQG